MSEEKRTGDWCARCKEDFPIAEEPTLWRMGELRLLSKAPRWMRNRLVGYAGKYLCGNCYFDMLDEKEEAEREK